MSEPILPRRGLESSPAVLPVLSPDPVRAGDGMDDVDGMDGMDGVNGRADADAGDGEDDRSRAGLFP